jgi:hypothetical protein
MTSRRRHPGCDTVRALRLCTPTGSMRGDHSERDPPLREIGKRTKSCALGNHVSWTRMFVGEHTVKPGAVQSQAAARKRVPLSSQNSCPGCLASPAMPQTPQETIIRTEWKKPSTMLQVPSDAHLPSEEIFTVDTTSKYFNSDVSYET